MDRDEEIAQLIENAEPIDTQTDLKLAQFELTDLGNAKRFLTRYGKDFKWCKEIGWLHWNGICWCAEDASNHLDLAIQATVRLVTKEAEAAANWAGSRVKAPNVAAWAHKSQSAHHIACIERLVRPELNAPLAAFDADPFKINLLNGTLVVGVSETEDYVQLKPHDRADLITRVAQVHYDPKADCSRYDEFLAYVQPDPDVRHYLHKWGGYSLTGDTSFQCLAFHYGKGRNGKSTLMDAWSYIAGDYASSTPIETLLDQGRLRRGGDATPDLARLPGVRMLITSEPERGAKMAEAQIKLLTGGEEISARHLMKDFFEFKPQCKVSIAGNYRPQITGTDEGIWRRMRLIPWTVTVPEEKVDRTLPQKLREEASGILNRLLDGLRDLLDNGLEPPPAIAAATKEYRESSDPLGRFLEACVLRYPGHRVQAQPLHEAFEAWAIANGETVWTPKGLNKAMCENGYRTIKSGVTYYLDIKLTRSADDFKRSPAIEKDEEIP